MRLLLINPNTTKSVSDLVESVALKSSASDTRITTVTAPFGVAYIENTAEAIIGAHAVFEMLAVHRGAYDAAVVAAFGDPGVTAARELLDVPVVGVAESALLTACLLGKRFSIIAITQRIAVWYREHVKDLGISERLASVRALDRPLGNLDSVQTDQREHLLRLSLDAVETDNADAIILGGAPLAGMAHSIVDHIPVPVIDGVTCAVKQAELLCSLGVAKSRPRVGAKGTSGLSAALARLLGHAPSGSAR